MADEHTTDWEEGWRRWQQAAQSAAGGLGSGAPAEPLAAFGAAYLACARELWDWYSRAASASPSAFRAEDLQEFARRFFAAAAPPTFSPAAVPPWTPPAAPTAPALGWLREHQQKLQAWQRAAERAAAAHARWLAALAPAAAQACTALTGALASGAAPTGPRALFELWVEAAESAWARVAHGEDYVRAQTALFDAGLELRLAQQALADEAARLLGVPTRAEVDDLQRRLQQLERGAS